MQRSYGEEYFNHTALNLGQAARDLRYFFYHPDADEAAEDGSAKHFLYSGIRRAKSLGNNLFYSLIPPHWHHTAEDLISMKSGSAKAWFLHGYAPWKYEDPTSRPSAES